MITIGNARLLILDSDPNGVVSGNAGSIAVVGTSLFVCEGGTVWRAL